MITEHYPVGTLVRVVLEGEDYTGNRPGTTRQAHRGRRTRGAQAARSGPFGA
jgi:hypothetical protein